MSTSYPTDLTDEQWELLSVLIPPENPGYGPRCVDLRGVVSAIFYILCAGCAWRMLPHDYPKWQTVYYYFRKWRMDGTWESMNHKLQQWVRVLEDREPNPSAAIVDCQSVENGTMVSQAVGFDSGKLVKGRKRHLLVDTLGLVLMVVVTSAYESDKAGARKLFTQAKNRISASLTRLVCIWVDAGYQGEGFMKWVMDTYRWILEVVRRPTDAKGFVLLPRRWVVERSFGWFNWCRRLSKDYEILPQPHETFVQIAMIRLMLTRLA